MQGESCGWPAGPCDDGLFCDASFVCVPRLADGKACGSHDQCASGFCNEGSRKCDPDGLVGEPCASDTDCRRLACSLTTGRCGPALGEPCSSPDECQTGACAGSVCVVPIRFGEPCTESGACSTHWCNPELGRCAMSCSYDFKCPEGEYCAGGGCMLLRGDGATCEWDTDCQSGRCRLSGRCGPVSARGEECMGTADCRPHLRCAAGTCRPYAEPEGPCDERDSCELPYLCLDGRCERMGLACEPGAEGARCTWFICAEGTYCDREAYRCVRSRPVGAACATSEECMKSAVCTAGTCLPHAAIGEECGERECIWWGAFCDHSVEPPRCSGPKPDGEPCLDRRDCQSNVCARGGSGDGLLCGGGVCVMPQ